MIAVDCHCERCLSEQVAFAAERDRRHAMRVLEWAIVRAALEGRDVEPFAARLRDIVCSPRRAA
jgi:hypothetical protein